MPHFSIVARKFSAPEFADYAAHIPLDVWKPDLVVLHNTAAPTLAARPNGLSEANIRDLQGYYADVQGWSGGPHLFVDQTGIWVFNPLDHRGVHSPSWNARSWGVEMLGDYAAEPFDSGDGLKVQTLAFAALAALFRRLGVPTVTDANFKLHKEDPKTTHDCPGRHVEKAKVMTQVQTLLPSAAPATAIPAKVVVCTKAGGQNPTMILDASLRGGTVYADARALSAATGITTSRTGQISVRALVAEKYDVSWKPETHRVYLAER